MPSTTNPILKAIVSGIVNPALEALFGLSVLLFLWGVFQLIYRADDPEQRAKGRDHILYGIFGIFVIVSSQALVYYAGNFFVR